MSLGTIGEERLFRAVRTNLGVFRTDCSVTDDLMIHDVSVANWLAGFPPSGVSSEMSVTSGSMEWDTASAVLEYDNGMAAHLYASWFDPEKRHEITIVGTAGAVTWRAPDEFVTVHRKYARPPDVIDGDSMRVSIGNGEPLLGQACEFLNRIETDQGVVEQLLEIPETMARIRRGG